MTRAESAEFQRKLDLLRATASSSGTLWERIRTPARDASASGYDLALCSHAARVGSSDLELGALMYAQRRKHGGDAAGKILSRPHYVRETIARAQRHGARGDGADRRWWRRARRRFCPLAPHRPRERPAELLPVVHGGRCELLDDARLRAQLLGLERRTGRGTGRDVVDHAPRAHDDVANAAAGALFLVAAEHRRGRADAFKLSDLFRPGAVELPGWWPRSWPFSWYDAVKDDAGIRQAAAEERARLAAQRRIRNGGR